MQETWRPGVTRRQEKLIYETQCDKSDTAIDQELASSVSFLLVCLCVFISTFIHPRNVKWMHDGEAFRHAM